MTDGDVFRKAAALMRERAESALPADATSEGGEITIPWAGQMGHLFNDRVRPHFQAFAHPAVALAVADWLDQHARYHNLPCKLDGCGALAVATAYLGGEQ